MTSLRFPPRSLRSRAAPRTGAPRHAADRPSPAADTPPPAAASPPPAAAGAATTWLALALACGASFIAFLDVTITNLAIPDLAGDFAGTGLATLSWVVTLYTVLFAALLSPAGRLADIVGRRTLFMVGVTTFTLMSLAAALAPSVTVLLIARAVQGAGAAAMIPASLAFVLGDIPAARRPAAIGLWSAGASVAAAVGPALGGVLVDAFGWRSLFLINVPMGAAMIGANLYLPATARGARRLPDVGGTVLLAVGIALAALGVTQASSWGWGDARTIGSLAVAAVVLAIVLRRSSGHPAPAIETGLWRIRAFALANVASLFFGAALYAWLLLGVLFLTRVWGYSELEAGLAMSPGAVTAAAVGLTIGRLPRRPSPRALIAGGALVMVACGLWLALWLPSEPRFLEVWLPIGMIVGLGMGAASVGTSSAGALSVPPPRFAGATGLNLTARQFGGALGIAALATILGSAGGDSVASFEDVYLFCALASVGAAIAALGIVLRPAGAAAAPNAASAARARS